MRKRVTTVATGLALVATLLLGAPAAVRATTADELWVAQRGSASAPGSSCSRPGYVGTTHAAIQDAIDDAADNAVIHICPGTYAIGGSGLNITGIVVTLSGAGAKNTILDGGATVTADGTWVSGGVRIVTTDDALTLLNLTLQNGSAHGVSDGGSGGAVLNTLGNLSVIRCVFRTNNARYEGGAIRQFPSGREVTIVDSVFANNHATEEEGGALSLSSSALITRSSFRNNSSGDGYDGGAVFSAGSLDISSSSFTGNHSLSYGGAIAASDDVTVTNSTFARNSALSYGGAIHADGDVSAAASVFTNNVSEYGGAIYSTYAATTSSTFRGNIATGDGGAIYATDASVTRSTFANNTSDSKGGAIFAEDEVLITSSTFTKNRATDWGAGVYAGGDVSVVASTFTANIGDGADTSGGAIGTRGDITVSSSAFTKNVAGYGGAVYANGGGVVMTANTFTTNTAKVLGGAVFSMGSTGANFAASTGNSFAGNRAPSGSGGGAIWICGDLSTAMSHFRATNTLRSNSSPDIYNPSC